MRSHLSPYSCKPTRLPLQDNLPIFFLASLTPSLRHATSPVGDATRTRKTAVR